MTDEKNLEALYGPPALYSDHKRGEHIKFYDNETQQEKSGPILWVCAPRKEEGREYPTTYVVGTPGFPTMVYPGDIIEKKES